MIIALYFVLAKLTIPIGNLHITLASLAVVVSAALFGPVDGCVTAFVGEFLIQALGQYGLTPTTPLWCLPPVLRTLIVGITCLVLDRKRVPVKTAVIWFFAAMIVGALATTIGNTLVTWLDAVIFNYYSWAYVFGQLTIRLITGVVTAVIVGVITVPLLRALRQINGIGGLRWFVSRDNNKEVA